MSDKTFLELAAMTEEQARAYLEEIRWPDGAACVHCGDCNPTKLNGKAHRSGVWKCNAKGCRQQFTVTVNTIFHRSHIPLKTWVLAFHIVCASKKGVSALQLQRQLGLKSYKSAWHMAHRIRHAMREEPLRSMLTGDVEVDEGYIGGKPRGPNYGRRPNRKTPKIPVMVLVERGGQARARALEKVTADTLKSEIRRTVAPTARVMTDDLNLYKGTAEFIAGGHETVNHSRNEYVRWDDPTVHTNTAENFIGLFKRGVHGAWHHISRQHIQRYLDEFTFRWGTRHMTDGQRTALALRDCDGKRLQYQGA